MTKKELIDAIYEETAGVSKTGIDTVINSLIKKIHANESLYIHGLGKFKHVVRRARKGRNPQTGEAVKIPEKVALTFRASR